MRTLTLFLLLSVTTVTADEKPKPKLRFTPGKTTTIIEKPVDANGRIDYTEAVNAKLSTGVTPTTNANVALWQVIGPGKLGGNGRDEEYFRRLGIEALAANGAYFIEFHTWSAKQTPPVEMWERDATEKLEKYLDTLPTGAELAALSAWLAANETPLKTVTDGVQRPHYYNPLVPGRKDGVSQGMLSCLLGNVQSYRPLGQALRLRASLRLQDGKPAEAWEDILACHRLARHVGQGGCLIELLVGLSLERGACDATLEWLRKAKPDAAALAKLSKDLEALPPMPTTIDKVDLMERYVFLDNIMRIDEQGLGFLAQQKERDFQGKIIDGILKTADWDPALELANEWYDRVIAVLKITDRAKRDAEWAKLGKQLQALRTQGDAASGIAAILLSGKPTGKAIGKAVGEILVSLMLPAANKVHDAGETNDLLRDYLRLAIALEQYRLEQKKYPATLTDLVPKQVKHVPGDLFSGKVLQYTSDGSGCTFWSTGPDGTNTQNTITKDRKANVKLTVRLGTAVINNE